MTGLGDEFDDLRQLTAALCDGEITPGEAARLEQLVAASESARRYFQEITTIHAELCWDLSRGVQQAAVADPLEVLPSPASPATRATVAVRKPRFMYLALATSLLLLVAGAVALFRLSKGDRASERIHLAATADAQWSEDAAPAEDGSLPLDRPLVLRQGLAEVAFPNGVRAILQGPAMFEPQSPSSARLSEGQLTARVPPEAAGFTIHTPDATIVDHGTEFAVAVQKAGVTEVHVFDGRVELLPPSTQTATERAWSHMLAGGEGRRIVSPPEGGESKPEPISFGSRHFARSLGGSVSRLQSLVRADPHLIHYYPFEGATVEERRRDCRGRLDLREVAMAGGDGGGRIDYGAPGASPSAQAVRPFRSPKRGDSCGVALESLAAFRPPSAMTIELLLSFADPGADPEGAICVAVGARRSRQDCGFFVAANGGGQLVQMLDGQAQWLESGVPFVTGKWYYVATTFQVQGAETVVNTYVADVSQREGTLKCVVRDQVIPGAPGAGCLAIGAGSDGELNRAYPWSGALDEVAIYDVVLDQETLDGHFHALTEGAE